MTTEREREATYSEVEQILQRVSQEVMALQSFTAKAPPSLAKVLDGMVAERQTTLAVVTERLLKATIPIPETAFLYADAKEEPVPPESALPVRG